MNKLFHRLSTRILLGILLAAAISAVVYTAANGALKAFFQYYAMQPEVFQRLSAEHFADLQDFATENHIVSTDGKPFTQWNDKYHYVSLMVIRQNEGLCYNSFVSYNMTYTEEDSQTFFWGSKVLPTYEYQLQLEDETCKVYFSGYFDQAYTSLRKAICGVLFVASFVTAFFLLFQKYIRYIGEMEQNVSSLCNKNFSQQIPIRYKTELSTLAANINHLGDTIQLLLLTEDAKLKQKEQFVKSIAHDIRTPLTVVIGYLELLSKGYAGSQESAQLFIDRALEKTNHIRRLTDDLFTFEENCRTLPLDTYDGQELLRQVISNITNFLTSNRFRLEYTSFVSQPFRMRANVTLLMRLIDNICSNIAKHGAPEKPVVLTVSAAEGYLVLEERNAILRKTVMTAAADSGYGLAICEDVMGAMGGSISHRTQGGLFSVTLRFPILPQQEG